MSIRVKTEGGPRASGSLHRGQRLPRGRRRVQGDPAGSKESFEKKLQTLREKASDPDNVCFSFGYCYNDSGMDIRDAMRIADEEMYKDKEKYYFEHPERKYR